MRQKVAPTEAWLFVAGMSEKVFDRVVKPDLVYLKTVVSCFESGVSVYSHLGGRCLLIFGVLRYSMRKFGYEPALMILAFVLSPILEHSLRQSLLMSCCSFTVFLTSPVSLACLIILAVLLLVLAFLPMIRKKREEIVALEEE
jgi:putative tricarboxylic transport membrane protein